MSGTVSAPVGGETCGTGGDARREGVGRVRGVGFGGGGSSPPVEGVGLARGVGLVPRLSFPAAGVGDGPPAELALAAELSFAISLEFPTGSSAGEASTDGRPTLLASPIGVALSLAAGVPAGTTALPELTPLSPAPVGGASGSTGRAFGSAASGAPSLLSAGAGSRCIAKNTPINATNNKAAGIMIFHGLKPTAGGGGVVGAAAAGLVLKLTASTGLCP
ncbi:MAG: hypothetical protein ACRD9R_22380, partial [Pyrinomonadaceae bacterium]